MRKNLKNPLYNMRNSLEINKANLKNNSIIFE